MMANEGNTITPKLLDNKSKRMSLQINSTPNSPLMAPSSTTVQALVPTNEVSISPNSNLSLTTTDKITAGN